MPKIPTITWYQRRETLYFSIHCVDVKDYTLELKGSRFSFKAGDEYAVNAECQGKVELQTENNNGRVIRVVGRKKEVGFWDGLFHDSDLNRSHVRVDWQNWQDEEDSEDFDSEGVGGFGDTGDTGGMGNMAEMMQQMGGGNFAEMMQKMGGLGGMDSSSSGSDSEGCGSGCQEGCKGGCGGESEEEEVLEATAA